MRNHVLPNSCSTAADPSGHCKPQFNAFCGPNTLSPLDFCDLSLVGVDKKIAAFGIDDDDAIDESLRAAAAAAAEEADDEDDDAILNDTSVSFMGYGDPNDAELEENAIDDVFGPSAGMIWKFFFLL